MTTTRRIAVCLAGLAVLPAAALGQTTTSATPPYVPPAQGTTAGAGWTLAWQSFDLGTCSLASGTATANSTGFVGCSQGSSPPATVAASAFGNVWTGGTASYTVGNSATALQVVSPATGAVIATATVQGVVFPKAAVQGGSYLWLAGSTAEDTYGRSYTSVVAVDSTGTARKSFRGSVKSTQAGALSAAYGGGYVWVGDSTGRISALSPSSGKLVRTISTPNTRALAVSGSTLWALNAQGRTVKVFNTSNGQQKTSLTVSGAPTAVVVASGSVYVFTETNLYRYSPKTLKQTGKYSLPVQGLGAWMGAAAGPGGIWASNYIASVARFNTATNAFDVYSTWSNSNTAGPLVSTGTALWVPDINGSPFPVGHAVTRFTVS